MHFNECDTTKTKLSAVAQPRRAKEAEAPEAKSLKKILSLFASF